MDTSQAHFHLPGYETDPDRFEIEEEYHIFIDLSTYIIGIQKYWKISLTCATNYEYTPPAFAAAVRVLFGEVQAQGHLPVSLPGLYPLVHE
jgi:hypothetical protein